MNLRDVGGVRTREGRVVRRGLVYRCSNLDASVVEEMARQNVIVRTVIDLRSANEVDHVRYLPRGARCEWIPLLQDGAPTRLSGGRARDAVGLLVGAPDVNNRTDPRRAAEIFLAVRVAQVQRQMSIDILPTVAKQLRGIFTVFAARGRLPVLCHCHAGKDRTGLVMALLLSLLGVPADAVIADYCMSNTDWADAQLTRCLRSYGIARNVRHDHLLPLFGVPPTGIDTLLRQLDEGGGAYDVLNRVGIPKSILDGVRGNLLADEKIDMVGET